MPKKDGTTRFCVDYRQLNAGTVSDAYPMPRMDELLDELAGARYLTTMDLSKGYWQIPLTKESREKSAFITLSILYEFLVMPFGMKNAPATFQRLVNRLLEGMQGFARAYLDDIAVFSNSWESHLGLYAISAEKVLSASVSYRHDFGDLPSQYSVRAESMSIPAESLRKQNC